MADIKSIIERISKLRALSSSSNVNEASTAAAIAEKLIQEYNLSEAELQATTGKSDPIVEGAVLYSSGRIVPWKSELALSLAAHMGVFVYNQISLSDKGRQVSNYRMVGRQSDIDILHYQYCFFVYEIERLADRNCARVRGVSIEKLSYCAGAVCAIMVKLRNEKKLVQAQATTAALAIIDNKYNEAKENLESRIKLGKSNYNPQSRFDANAFQRGQKAGENIHVNTDMNTRVSVSGRLGT
jgi:hypothetical protein